VGRRAAAGDYRWESRTPGGATGAVAPPPDPAVYGAQVAQSAQSRSAHLREEVAEDYRRMVYGKTREVVESARRSFLKKWRLRCAVVAASLEEAGEELFTFLNFPPSQWKGIRTTNALERINEEFRRRTKTQASLPNEDAVVLLLFGLLRSGQIRLRRFDGWKDMSSAPPMTERQAA
jgi:Transposase and inactivated derivatives